MLALHGGSAANLEIEPNPMGGLRRLVRGGPGTALVGSHTEIAAKIKAYAALGLEEFVLSGVPHLEEAYWFAEGVLPLLQREGLLEVIRAAKSRQALRWTYRSPRPPPASRCPRLQRAESLACTHGTCRRRMQPPPPRDVPSARPWSRGASRATTLGANLGAPEARSGRLQRRTSIRR